MCKKIITPTKDVGKSLSDMISSKSSSVWSIFIGPDVTELLLIVIKRKSAKRKSHLPKMIGSHYVS